jgi:acetyltransferase
VGRALVENLISQPFGATIFPINPGSASILGLKAYPSLVSLPEVVELAIIATPAPTVPALIAECVETGVKGAIILSAGFKETGAGEARLEQEVLAQARHGNLRLLGADCLGVMNPVIGLNATFAHAMAHPGSVAFLSQSSALCTAVLDWSLATNVGFSAFISPGSMLDVGWGELIAYLGDDPSTTSIVMYQETIADARAFLSAAREVTRRKPIIILKGGRTVTSHTGALTGSYAVFDAACRRSGILVVERIDELFSMAEVLARQPRPQGPRLAIVTNAGGPGILASDALTSSGCQLAQLAPQTLATLDQILPASWSHNNPVDIPEDADPQCYARVLAVIARDPNSDGLLVILTPRMMTDPTLVAQQVKCCPMGSGKPILASWMGGSTVEDGRHLLNEAGIPTFAYPDAAVRAFAYMWQYTFRLRGLYETPLLSLDTERDESRRTRARLLLETAAGQGRTLLTGAESRQLLSAYGIPCVETHTAQSCDEAVACADALGYPVALKLLSETLTHKSTIGGVQLNLHAAEAVRQAYKAIATAAHTQAERFQGVSVQPMIQLDGYELMLGSSTDAQFGPVLLFGSGGRLTEVYQDQSFALPPLTTSLARRLMEQTRIFAAFQGMHAGPPIDLAALEVLLVRFSSLVAEQRRIKEIDINPLFVSPRRLLALDARVILHDPHLNEQDLPALAIRPYPLRYIQRWTLPNGTPVTLRPIRPEDEPLIIAFHRTLSEQSVYFRWLHMIGLSQRIAHERLIGTCFIDYDQEMALVVDYANPQTGQHEILGVGRLIKARHEPSAEFALLIADQFQHQGLGTELLRRLIQIGRDEKLQHLTGDMLIENLGMQTICKNLGFRLRYAPADHTMRADLEL